MNIRLVSAAAAIALSHGAYAQAPADFYKGRNVNVLIGVGVGGFYDLNARVVARHIGKHIPGQPTLVPQNMTGRGRRAHGRLPRRRRGEGRREHRDDSE